MDTPISEYLDQQYDAAMASVASGESIETELSTTETTALSTILQYSESAKAVLTVFLTSVVYKMLHPEQDIRNHQGSIPGGYSGRTFDAKNITPFLKRHKFPAMAESGWLTRSLEQKTPYSLNYNGAITPEALKTAFLTLIDGIEHGADCEKYLNYILQVLIIKRNKHLIELAKPTALQIDSILQLLYKHFNAKYVAEGASRLPTLAIYAIYDCLVKELKRFEEKTLLPIETHTSADQRSGRIGDIQINDDRNRPFEAVEIKHGIAISLQLVQDAYAKFQTMPVKRYYILSTASQTNNEEIERINEEINKIKNIHGCQLIVNGIMGSLRYYLRLLNDTYEFIDCYVKLIENDTALKFEHKQKWNSLISEM